MRWSRARSQTEHGPPRQLSRRRSAGPLRHVLHRVAVVVVFLCLAGCGGEGEKATSPAGADPKEWTAEVCSLLVDARDGFGAVATETQADLESRTGAGPRIWRRLLVRGMSEELQLWEEAIARLEALGPPAVEGGVAIQHTFWAELVQGSAVQADSLERSRVIPVDTPEHFFAEAEVLSAHFREAGKVVFDELPPIEGLDSRELAEGWKATPCGSG